VVSSSATSLVFRAPARLAGVYDVHVFATDGTEALLTAALTYVDGAGAGTPGAGTPGSDTPGAGTPSTGTPVTPANGTPGTPGTGTPVTPANGTPGTPGTGTGGSGAGGGAEPVVTTGPGGERLVRTTKFAALGAIWSLDCSASCSGVAI
jgi:hypothetical protein